MNPLLLLGLLHSAPGILSSLGLMGGDPMKKLQAQLMALLSPEHQALLQKQFTQQAMQSPAYSQAQGQIASGANATSGNLARSLGARGIGNSGTASVLSSLSPSIVGGQQAALNTAASQMGERQAQNTLQGQASALMGTGGQPSQTQQYFAGGLDAFGPLLNQYFKNKFPSAFGTQGGGGMASLQQLLGLLGSS